MTPSDNTENVIDREAAFDTLPLLSRERIWGFTDFSAINVGLAIATWGFLIGGTTALLVGVRDGLIAIVVGNIIGVALMAIATCLPASKFGIEQFTGLRSIFGTRGTQVLVFGFVALIMMGWTAVLSIMFGRATSNVLDTTLGVQTGDNSVLVSMFAVGAIIISWLVLTRGPLTIKWMNRLVAPLLALTALVMLILIFSERSWGELLAAEPLLPFGDRRLDFIIAVEFNLAAGLSWWPVMGSLARLTKGPRAAFWPNMIGIFAAAAVAEAVGLFAALTLGDSDPTVWMVPLGGALLGVIALVFVAFANISSTVTIIYSTCLALRQSGGTVFRKLSWPKLTAGFFVPPLVLVFFPASIYDNFFTFLAWTAVIIAPLTGVGITDYFVLRRTTIDVAALYDTEPNSPYSFWREFNPLAAVSVVAGAVTYLYLLDPVALTHRFPFTLLSASLPSLLVAGIVHFGLSRLIAVPRGRGAYAPRSTPVEQPANR